MGSVNFLQLILGILLAAVVAFVAFRLRSLSRSGAIGAFVLGAVVFGFGGLPWACLLLVFFVTSSGLSGLMKRRKKKIEAQFAKSSRRDVWQVAANGGVAGLAVLLGIFFPHSIFPWVIFTAALAAANADTWATELGLLSKNWPRSIRNFRPVSPGTSGGISLMGTLAAAAGAAAIALTTRLIWPTSFPANMERWSFALIIFAAGLIGSLVDSLLGATVQGIYNCPVCDKETEKHPKHTCGNNTVLIRGWKWMNNDVVNLACTGSAAIIACIWVALLH